MGIQAPQPGSRPFKQGDLLRAEGDIANTLYIILKGKVGIHVSSEPGRDGLASEATFRDAPGAVLRVASYKLFDLESNIFLGASDLVTGGVCSCTSRASEDGILYSYPVDGAAQLYNLSNAQKDYATFIIQSLGRLLEKTSNALATLRERTVRLSVRTDNLALYFWILKESHGFDHMPGTPFFQDALKRLGEMRENGFQPPFRFDPTFIDAAPTANGTTSPDAPPGGSTATRQAADAPNISPDAAAEGPAAARQVAAPPNAPPGIFPVPDSLSYAIRLNSIPLETRKLFFGADPQVAARHIREASDCLNDLLAACRKTFAEAEELFRQLYAESGDSLFSAFLKAARETALAGQDPTAAVEALDYLIKLIRETADTFEHQYAHPSRMDLEYIGHSREQLAALLSGSSGETSGEEGLSCLTALMQALPEELRDSAAKLLIYAGADKELSETFMFRLNAFRNLKDRYAMTPEARSIRGGMSDPFRRLYEPVLRRALAENDHSRLITMFLRYGYADEWLLDPEQTLSLFRLGGRNGLPPAAPKAAAAPARTSAPSLASSASLASLASPASPASLASPASASSSTFSGQVPVYTLPEWLGRIHNRQAEPSRNEFDTDYADVFRELKKQRKLTDRDKPAYDANVDAKLSFELDVQLGTCQKAVHGKNNIFYPLLHRAMITCEPDKAAITPEKVREALECIQAVDYSAFWREVRFTDPRKVIEKERIMKYVVPDIILLPTFGSRGMMWQEISGRDRGMPGRLLLPAFTNESLDTLLVRLVGNFRWELCITLMGSASNDVTQHSLTSEYNAYIQFYKKNHDLSEGERDATRQQIEKCKGIMREIFTADYEVWIRNESQGNLRLNKEVRRIMSRYCPFGKAYREKLANHPAHANLLRMFQAQQTKEARSIESRYSRFRSAAQGHLDPDLEENLRYFRDL